MASFFWIFLLHFYCKNISLKGTKSHWLWIYFSNVHFCLWFSEIFRVDFFHGFAPSTPPAGVQWGPFEMGATASFVPLPATPKYVKTPCNQNKCQIEDLTQTTSTVPVINLSISGKMWQPLRNSSNLYQIKKSIICRCMDGPIQRSQRGLKIR